MATHTNRERKLITRVHEWMVTGGTRDIPISAQFFVEEQSLT
jgi:hypothetical protein